MKKFVEKVDVRIQKYNPRDNASFDMLKRCRGMWFKKRCGVFGLNLDIRDYGGFWELGKQSLKTQKHDAADKREVWRTVGEET